MANADNTTPRVTACYWMRDGVRIQLSDGRLIRVPFAYNPRVLRASEAAQRHISVSAAGDRVSWPTLGVDWSIDTILEAVTVIVDPGPGETLPADVTTRDEGYA